MNGVDALSRSAAELLTVTERHRALLRALSAGVDPGDGGCLLRDCAQRRHLRRALREAIEVLEDTRRSFKSKQLEALRRQLIRVLAEDA
jgi:hypothetical protein